MQPLTALLHVLSACNVVYMLTVHNVYTFNCASTAMHHLRECIINCNPWLDKHPFLPGPLHRYITPCRTLLNTQRLRHHDPQHHAHHQDNGIFCLSFGRMDRSVNGKRVQQEMELFLVTLAKVLRKWKWWSLAFWSKLKTTNPIRKNRPYLDQL